MTKVQSVPGFPMQCLLTVIYIEQRIFYFINESEIDENVVKTEYILLSKVMVTGCQILKLGQILNIHCHI